jgi:hypothetical protein
MVQLEPLEPELLVEPKPPRWLWVGTGAVCAGLCRVVVADWPGVEAGAVTAGPPRNNQGRSQKKPPPPPIIVGAQE